MESRNGSPSNNAKVNKMLAELILNVFGEIAARRYRSLRWVLWLGILACIGRIIYACMKGPIT